ncbi:purine-nucleoside phosphorylase [Sulfidibacter corallicola]|uniref:Purine nucleoside phosphorylase n=1 Tax=Sulfidibacter corallicola TaxID=2818388 RepID=A0A8A4TM77_SULCO|nr:purine-nucleoside phosphorylase [Sulfidibacter corallicola]QTD49971.1 purine-nucleoside phosphorylase [Sulfidibacter corallicola]
MTETQDTWRKAEETKAFLMERVPNFNPRIGIVLGSGLGQFARRIEVNATIPYGDIPHFRPTSVAGHPGNLIFGTLAGHQIVCQQGRYHYYEGHSISETIFPIRVMKALGVETLIVSNAAGGINLDFRKGDIMLIRDQINFQGTNPLIGPNAAEFGPRFPDMTHAFDPEYAEAMLAVAKEMGITLKQGVYISVTGPSYETPAEIRMFRAWGADAVGMSTANEVIAANHCGMRVLGLSCISNEAAGITDEKLSHDDVGDVVSRMSERFESLVEAWVKAR